LLQLTLRKLSHHFFYNAILPEKPLKDTEGFLALAAILTQCNLFKCCHESRSRLFFTLMYTRRARIHQNQFLLPHLPAIQFSCYTASIDVFEGICEKVPDS
jgi:hypothetical protein